MSTGTSAAEPRHGIGVSPGTAYGPVVQVAPPVRPPADEPKFFDEAHRGKAAMQTLAKFLADNHFDVTFGYPRKPATYFDAYVDHFGFRDRIRFEFASPTALARVFPSFSAAAKENAESRVRVATYPFLVKSLSAAFLIFSSVLMSSCFFFVFAIVHLFFLKSTRKSGINQ